MMPLPQRPSDITVLASLCSVLGIYSRLGASCLCFQSYISKVAGKPTLGALYVLGYLVFVLN